MGQEHFERERTHRGRGQARGRFQIDLTAPIEGAVDVQPRDHPSALGAISF
jgi:hypothetical protein